MLSSQKFLKSYTLDIKHLILALCLDDCRDYNSLYVPQKISWGCGIIEPIKNSDVFDSLDYAVPPNLSD